MNTSRRAFVIGVASLLMLGCVAAGFGREPVRAERAKSVADLVPLFETTLPYEGPGTVAILDDGSVVVQVGDMLLQTTIDEVTPPPSESSAEQVSTTHSETIVYQLDSSGLTLVEHDDEFFLDKNGAQIEERGLSLREVSMTAFPDQAQIDADPNRYALLSLSGEMHLGFDGATRTLSITITDDEDTGRVFTLAAAIVRSTVATGQRSDSARPVIAETVDDSDDSILLSVRADTVVKCSATCANGDCTINCKKKGCKAYCNNGTPVCVCTNVHSAP